MDIQVTLTDEQVFRICEQLFKRSVSDTKEVLHGRKRSSPRKKRTSGKKLRYDYPELESWLYNAVKGLNKPVRVSKIYRYIKKEYRYKGSVTTLFTHLALLVKKKKIKHQGNLYSA